MNSDSKIRYALSWMGALAAALTLGKCSGESLQLAEDKAALITAIIEKHDDPKTPRDIVWPLWIVEGVNPTERIIYFIENPSIQWPNIDRELLITALAAEWTDSRDVEEPTPAEETPVVQ